MLKTICLFMALSLAFSIASCGAGTSSARQDVTRTTAATTGGATTSAHFVTMPESTAIAVTLDDSIDTDVQVSGATFHARLSEPIVVEGHTLFADSAAAIGVLSKVVESGRLDTPAELNFSLTAIQNVDGHWIDVGTNMVMEKKASHATREVAMIGGGAVVGGIIGKIIDKKGSTEIGAATGAAAGVGLAAATGKQDIFYGAGTEVVFFSSRSMQIETRY